MYARASTALETGRRPLNDPGSRGSMASGRPKSKAKGLPCNGNEGGGRGGARPPQSAPFAGPDPDLTAALEQVHRMAAGEWSAASTAVGHDKLSAAKELAKVESQIREALGTLKALGAVKSKWWNFVRRNLGKIIKMRFGPGFDLMPYAINA